MSPSTPSAARRVLLPAGILVWGALAMAACGPAELPEGRAVLSAEFSVRADVDSVRDHSGFEVAVLSNLDGDLDTLALAVTDASGTLEMPVRVPVRGIFPVVVSRAGTQLAIDQLVLADGDSIRVRGVFPLDGRRLRIVSRENAAWTAYRNTRAAYNRTLVDLLESGNHTDATVRQAVLQTGSVLWSLRDLYPGTLGATVAEAESISLLESWDDSLAVARFRELGAGHLSVVNLVRAVRRSIARLEGQDAAVGFVRGMVDSVDAADALVLRSELVVAYMDSLDRVNALAEARSLLADAADTEWASWAGRAIYELEHLMPGMQAPSFAAIDVFGRPVVLDSLRGVTVLVEFYSPTNETFLREIPERGALLNAVRNLPFSAISVSVEPDSALNVALLDGRRLFGRFVFDPDGLDGELARNYNVNVVPTRYLIGPDGAILAKYTGPGLDALRRDLVAVFAGRR